MSPRRPRSSRIPRGLAVALAVAFALRAFPATARAAVVMSLSPASINATSGDVGQILDVLLTNNTGVMITLGSFSFQLQASSSNITMTQANTSSPVYVFGASSFSNQFDGGILYPLFGETPGPGLIATDFTTDLDGRDIANGETVSLGRVVFNVSGGPATHTVAFTNIGAGTSLADESNVNIDLSGATFEDATIIVAAIPEPSSLTLAATMAVIAALGCLRKRRAGPAAT